MKACKEVNNVSHHCSCSVSYSHLLLYGGLAAFAALPTRRYMSLQVLDACRQKTWLIMLLHATLLDIARSLAAQRWKCAMGELMWKGHTIVHKRASYHVSRAHA